MSFKNFIEQNKFAVAVGLGTAGLLGLLLYFKRDNNEQDSSYQRTIDPSIKNVPLFDRLGGDFCIDALVSRFLDRLNSEKTLKKYTQQIKIKSHQAKITQYVKQAFGGPVINMSDSLSLVQLKSIFSDLNISNVDFDKAVFHLEGTLTELAVDNKEINDAKKIFEAIRQQVVSQPK